MANENRYFIAKRSEAECRTYADSHIVDVCVATRCQEIGNFERDVSTGYEAVFVEMAEKLLGEHPEATMVVFLRTRCPNKCERGSSGPNNQNYGRYELLFTL